MTRSPESDDHIPDSEETPPSTTWMPRLVRLVALGLLGGSLAGGVIALGYGLLRSPPGAEQVALAPASPAASELAVAPSEREPAKQLRDAQAEVQALEAQLATRQAQLESVALAAGVPPGQLATTDLAAEVAGIRQNLLAARKVRDRLKTDLKAALAEVEAQTGEAARARVVAASWKEASTRSEWVAFAANAKAQLCDHGTKKRVERCRASVDGYFTAARFERYASCVEDGGATPVLLATRRDEPVLTTAERIESKELRGRDAWYVLYCDPTLPERVQLEASSG